MSEDQLLYSLHEVVARFNHPKTEIARAAALLRLLQNGRLKSVVVLPGLIGGEVVEVGPECWLEIQLNRFVGPSGAIRPGFTLKPEAALAEEKRVLRTLGFAIDMHSDVVMDARLGSPDQSGIPQLGLKGVFPPKCLSIDARTKLMARDVNLPKNPEPEELTNAGAHCDRRSKALQRIKQPLLPLVSEQALSSYLRAIRSKKGTEAKPRGARPKAAWPEIWKLAIERCPFAEKDCNAIARSIAKKLKKMGPPGAAYMASKLKALAGLSREEAHEKVQELLLVRAKAKT